MTHTDGSTLYRADAGNLFVRKSDGFIMGSGIDLGSGDSIDNYEERAFTEGAIADFERSVGVPRRRPCVLTVSNVSETE